MAKTSQASSIAWQPDRRQGAVLEAARAAGRNRDVEAICATAGVTPRTVYKWLRDNPDFTLAWGDVWHGAVARNLPGVVAAQIDKALGGDTASARFVAELGGALKRRAGSSGAAKGANIPEAGSDSEPRPSARDEIARRIAVIAARLGTDEAAERAK